MSLFSIARNLSLDHLRRRQKICLNTPDAEALLEVPEPDSHSPFAAVAKSEDAVRVAGAPAALEPIYREALLLRFQEELSLDEIAKVAGAPVVDRMCCSDPNVRFQRAIDVSGGKAYYFHASPWKNYSGFCSFAPPMPLKPLISIR